MSSQTRDEQQTTPSSKHELPLRLEAIGRSVLRALGQPASFQRVQVRSLWGDHFRANVFVGDDFLTSRIAHSFFVAADPDGNLTASLPPIKKQY